MARLFQGPWGLCPDNVDSLNTDLTSDVDGISMGPNSSHNPIKASNSFSEPPNQAQYILYSTILDRIILYHTILYRLVYRAPPAGQALQLLIDASAQKMQTQRGQGFSYEAFVLLSMSAMREVI